MLIEINNLSKYYYTSKGVNVKALDEVNLKIEGPGLIFIIGKSGSGKTTLLNLLGGIDSYDDGEIIVEGKVLNNLKKRDYDRYRLSTVGFVFQEYNLIEDLTVADNINLVLNLHGLKNNNESIKKILKQVDLEDVSHRFPNQLSMGQQQRVAIARALIKSPKIILADEPTGALDSETRKGIYELLKSIARERLVIVISHDQESAEYYGDRIIELSDGKVIKDVDKSIKREKAIKNQDVVSSSFSSLSFKRSLFLAKTNLFKTPIRWGLITIVSIISFLIMTISFVFGMYDVDRVLLQSLYRYEKDYLIIINQDPIEGEDYFINQEDLNNYRKQFPNYSFFPVFVQMRSIASCPYPFKYQMGASRLLSGGMEINEDFLQHFNFKMLGGRLPQENTNDNEIAISLYTFNQLVKCKYLTGSYEENIGKIVKIDDKEYVISGIIDTNFNYERYKNLENKSDLYYVDSFVINELYQLNYSLHTVAFVRPGYYETHFLHKDGVFKLDPTSLLTIDLSPQGLKMTQLYVDTIENYNSTEDIFWLDGIERDKLTGNEIVLSRKSINNMYRNDIPNYDNRLQEALVKIVYDYANKNFYKIEDIFNTPDEYAEYILNNDWNDYELGKHIEYFTNLAKEKVFADYYFKQDYKVTLKYRSFETTIKVVGFSSNMYASEEFIHQLIEEDEGNFIALVTQLNFTKSDRELIKKASTQTESRYYNIANFTAQTLYYFDSLFEQFSSFFTMIGLIFLCFSTFILGNQINRNINNQKKQIGILRALGASRNDVIKIYLAESMIVSIAIYVFTVLGGIYIVHWLNHLIYQADIIRIQLLQFTFLEGLLLLIFIIFITFIACFLPIYKLSKLQPVDLMKYLLGGRHD